MNDNISRQAAMAYPLSWEHYDKEHGDRKFICGVESYREYIEHLPSTDRKGHWTQKDYYDMDWNVYECDQCGEPWQLETGTPKDNNMNFCPHCGADMRVDNSSL